MPELLTPAFPCSSFAFPNIPLKFSPHSPVQETVIGKPIQGILLFRRKQVINLLPRLPEQMACMILAISMYFPN